MTLDSTHKNSEGSSAAPSRFAIADEDFYDLIHRPPIETRILIEQCLGDVPFALSLLEEFINILPDRRQKLIQAAQEANLSQVVLVAHSLKGASGYAAASHLSRRCAHLEEAAKSQDLAHTQELLRGVCVEIDRCIQEFPSIARSLSKAVA